MVFRRIGFALILVAFAGLLVFFYFKFQEKKIIDDDYFEAIPYQSIWVMDIKKPAAFFTNIQQGNLIVQDLLEANIWNSAYSKMVILDSILNGNHERLLPYENTSIIISLVPTGANKQDFLFSVKLGNTSLNDLGELFQNGFISGQPKKIKDYDGAELMEVQIVGSETPAFATFHRGYLLMSYSSMPIEDGIRQLNSELSIKADVEFKNVMETAGDNRMLNFYLNTNRWRASMTKYIDNQHSRGYSGLKDISGWVALDFMIKPSSVLMSGYSYSSDSTNNYFRIFEGQNEGSPEALSVLPPNTSFLVHYSISDFKTLRQRYMKYLNSTNRLEGYEKTIAKYLVDSLKTPDELFAALVGSELCYAVLEIPSDMSGQTISAVGDKSIGIIRMKDQEKGMELLRSFFKKESVVDTDSEYRDIEIFELAADGLLAAYFGDLFSPLANRFCANINGYAVFADRKSTIREMINAVRGEKTLDECVHFQTFKENLSSTSQLLVYSNVGRSPYLLSYFLNSDSKPLVEEQLPLFRKFDGLALQVSVDQHNRFYHNIFLSRNPIYKQVSASLWEMPLDTTPAITPQFFTNHYTQTEDIFIQDMANKVYLISNTGRVLWTRQLEDRIMGGINRVDRYKNEKYQMLFNTSNRIYLLDRNGKDVDGFPVKMKTGTRLPLSLMDYDRNRNYRIFYTDTNGSIDCYGIEGKEIKGWKYKGKSELLTDLKYMQIGNKDYLVGIRADAKVLILNRKGELRIRLKSQAFMGINSTLTLEKGSDLKSSFIVFSDTLGNISRISFDDKQHEVQLQGVSPIQHFRYIDIDLDGKRDYVIQTPNRLYIYDQSKNSMLIYSSSDTLELGIKSFVVENQNTLVTLNSTNSGKTYVLNSDGSRYDGSPFYGGHRGVLSDINLDGRLELITLSPEGMMYCYVLN